MADQTVFERYEIKIFDDKAAAAQDKVFIELKKKYNDVACTSGGSRSPSLRRWNGLCRGRPFPRQQIGNEIGYFFDYYGNPEAKGIFVLWREAFYALDGSDFRVTFDEQILARQEELSLSREIWGEPLLDDEQILMEIKTSGGIPLWMSRVLTQQKLYKTSFSKYGTAYEKLICRKKYETAADTFIA